MHLLQPLMGLLLISLAHADICPVLFSPVDVVVEFMDSFSVTCSSTSTTPQSSLSWKGYDERDDSEMISTTVNVTDWEMNVTCYFYSKETQCAQDLPITIYKTPDNVSISTVNHTGPMTEGEMYELQCDVHNMAPVQDFTVKWFKGQTLLDQTTFPYTSKTPVDDTATLLIHADRADDGAQYRCEAELDLGTEGPQPPTKTSDPLNVQVYYKPKYSNSTETIIKDNKDMLNCTVKANPAPTYTWDHLKEKNSSPVLESSSLSPGNYTCTATNTLGNDSKVFIVRDSQCPVQIIPRRAVVRYGDSVTADCSTSVQHLGIGWEASENPVPMIKDRNLITWNVSELTEWDIHPFCYINYKTSDQNLNQCTVELPVTVYKTPDSVSISTLNHTGPMMEGEMYVLQCGVINVAPVQNLTVKWYKEQTLLNQSNFTDSIKTPVNETATLLIRADRDDDGAQYWCEAELNLGEEGPQPPPTITSNPLNITVHYAPQIHVFGDWSTVTETLLDSYPLNVDSVTGNPRPDISWRHKSSSVNSSLPLSKYDSGLYEIIARNDLGNASCFLNITVEYPPQLNCSESYEVKEKILFHPPCTVDGLPKPEFFLYKNGKRLQGNFYPKWNDSGVYQLTTQNPHGTINSTFTISILYAPVFFNDSTETFVVGEDSNITLECNVTGNPEPELEWSFKNKIISTGGHHINIERATSTNAGVYTCSATNRFRSAKKTFIVEIKKLGYGFPYYILIILFLVLLIIIIVVLMWRRTKLRGHYEILPLEQHAMEPLSNGGPE